MDQSESSTGLTLKGLSDNLPSELYKFIKKRIRFKGQLQIYGSITLSSYSEIVATFLGRTLQATPNFKEEGEKTDLNRRDTGGAENEHIHVPANSDSGHSDMTGHPQSAPSGDETTSSGDAVTPGVDGEIYYIAEDAKLGLDDGHLPVDLISWFVQYIGVGQSTKNYGFDGHLNFHTENTNYKFDFHREFSDATSEINATVMSSTQTCENLSINDCVELAQRDGRRSEESTADVSTQTEAERAESPATETIENLSSETGGTSAREPSTPEDTNSLLQDTGRSPCKERIPQSENTAADRNIQGTTDNKTTLSLKPGSFNSPVKQEPPWSETEVQTPSRPMRRARQQHKFIKSGTQSNADVRKEEAGKPHPRASRNQKRPLADDGDHTIESEVTPVTKTPSMKKTKRAEPSSPSSGKKLNNSNIETKIVWSPMRRRTRASAKETVTTEMDDNIVLEKLKNDDDEDDDCIMVTGGEPSEATVKTLRSSAKTKVDTSKRSLSGLCVTCKVCNKLCIKKTVPRHMEVHKALGQLPREEGAILLDDLHPLDAMCNVCFKIFRKATIPKHMKLHEAESTEKHECLDAEMKSPLEKGSENRSATTSSETNLRNRNSEKSEQCEQSDSVHSDPSADLKCLADSEKGDREPASDSSATALTTGTDQREPEETDDPGAKRGNSAEQEVKTEGAGEIRNQKRRLTCKICEETCELGKLWRHFGVHKARDELPSEEGAILVHGLPRGRVMCDVCFDVLSKHHLQRHKERHQQQSQVIATAGSASEGSIGTVDTNPKLSTSLRYCETCESQFEGCWKRHQVMAHEADMSILGLEPEHFIMQCHVCSMKFPDKTLLEHHKKQKGHEGTSVHGALTDNGMIKKIPEPPDLTERIEAMVREETNLAYEFSAESAGTDSLKGGRTQARCLKCDKVFKALANAKEHVANYHLRVKRFECQVCGLKMASRGKVKVHLLSHTGEKPFVCTTCGKGFTVRYKLRRHNEDVHNGPPLFTRDGVPRKIDCICEICGAVLKGPRALQFHMSSKHKQGKYVNCDECGLRLKEEGLTMHKRQIHEKKIVIVCDLCGKGFRYRDSYRHHMISHKGIKPFKCEECGLEMVSSITYENHKNRHRGIKPHKCDVCEMAFCSYAELGNHKKKHLNKRAYKCTECSKAFNRWSALQSHKAVHKREFKYKCSICGKKFNQSSSCRTHEKRHTGIKPFACCYCDKPFVTKGDCKRHENTTHRGLPNPYRNKQYGKEKVTNQTMVLSVDEVENGGIGEVGQTVEVVVEDSQAVGEVLYLLSMQQGGTNLVTIAK